MASTVITKSANDCREYRDIVLSNKLRALLISDIKEEAVPCHDSLSDGTLTSEEDEYSDEDMDEESDGCEDEDEGDSSEDGDESENELAADHPNRKNAKETKEKLAAIALCIGIGSFSDPDDIPGMAHFLEHMVFMGSSKYPDENAFDVFVKKHGGSCNAGTDCERTVFQFDIRHSHLKEALDRFAHFFISPLMKVESVDRELSAIDSEFDMSKSSDSDRKQQLLASFAKPGHPMAKFLWGNMKTLKTDPAEKGIDMHRKLREFYERMYSGSYMTLAVQSRESLDTLESWVTHIFSDIPNNGIEKPNFSQEIEPFATVNFHKFYKVVPVRDIHQVEINWSLPCLQEHYRVKPLHYLGWLIGHEGQGSLLSLLKKKHLAVSLYSGNDESGFDHNSTQALFSITVDLTEEGFNQFWEVVKMVFQYIKMLQISGPQKRIYKEIQKIESNEFRFRDEQEPIEYVETLAENMQLYATQDYITGDQLMFEYNAELIADVTNKLSVEDCNIVLISKKLEEQCQLEEPFFAIKYSAEPLEPTLATLCKDLDTNSDLHFPSPNIYIANDFTLKTPDMGITEHPSKILDNEHCRLWFKKDSKFNTPKGYIYFHLISQLANQSAENLVLFDLFVTTLEHNLSETTYAADVALLEYSLTTAETGLILKINGLSHKMPLLFHTIVQYMANFSAHKMFEIVLEQTKRSYHNHLLKPTNLCNNVRLSIIQHIKFTPVDKMAFINSNVITSEKLEAFVEKFKENVFIEGLIQGNFTSKEGREMTEHIVEQLALRSMSGVGDFPQTRVMKMPRHRPTLCKVQNFNPKDPNSVVTNHYLSLPGDIRTLVLIELLTMMMEEPCFDMLRTKEQLGYDVYPTCRNSFGIVGFSLTVQTQATKFSVAHVDKRIEKFLESFIKNLEDLDSAEFITQRNSLIGLKKCVDLHLGEEVNRNWSDVVDRCYVFDRLEREIKYLENLDLADSIRWLKDHILGGKNYCKLSVQVVGVGNKEVCCNEQTLNGMGSYKLITLAPDEDSDVTVIENIAEFKSSLPAFEPHRLDH